MQENLTKADWDRIRLGFFPQLFATGSYGAFSLGCLGLVLALVLTRESATQSCVALACSLVFFLVSLPGFMKLPYGLLLAVGVIDFIVGLPLLLLSFPLLCFSGVGLVTMLVAGRLMAAANWIFAHGKQYHLLSREVVAAGPGENLRELEAGLLPNNRGFWGAETDSGPFWAFEKRDGSILVCSSEEESERVTASLAQLGNAQLTIPKQLQDTKKKDDFSTYPFEHVLLWTIELSAGKKELTLLVGPRAAQYIAKEFFPGQQAVKRVAARTSRLAIAAVGLAFAGPPGIIVGIISLVRILTSDHRLKGQYFSWLAIVVGLVFTALFGFVSTLPSPK